VVDPAATMSKDGNAVDLSQVMVSYNKAKTSYALALSKLLLQAKPRLRHEVRKDENGKSFLWITRQ
jgi:flagellar basal body rod protein FlgB